VVKKIVEEDARSDDARYERAVQKLERQKRRRIQDKHKGNRQAELKIKELSERNATLEQRFADMSRLVRALVKMLPADLRVEYEKLRVAINQGDFQEVHPDA
jgi:hypothetical protein